MDPKLKAETAENAKPAGDANVIAHSPSGINFPSVMAAHVEQPSNDPRLTVENSLSTLYPIVQEEEKDPTKKSTFAHGENLRQLGDLYLLSGDRESGLLSLFAATDVMHNVDDKSKEQELTLTETLMDYGTALLNSNKTEKLPQRAMDLKNADIVFDGVLQRVKQENRTPEDVTSVLKLKADTDIARADIENRDNVIGKSAYVSDLKAAITELNDGVTLMSTKSDNDSILTKARLHGELGFAEKEVNDTTVHPFYKLGFDRYDAKGDYKQAVDLFHQYKAGDNPEQQADKDKELITVLARYSSLLTADGDTAESLQAASEERTILSRHPNWKIQMQPGADGK